MISMPKTAEERKRRPVVTGVWDYFPNALLAVSEVSLAGNEQHNPGEPLHWAREKSKDHADALGRHLMQRGTLDTDGKRHSVKMLWRALALVEEEIEAEGQTFGDRLLVGMREAVEIEQGRSEAPRVATYHTQRDSQADGHKDSTFPVEMVRRELEEMVDGYGPPECEWCGYQQSECECVKWDKGL